MDDKIDSAVEKMAEMVKASQDPQKALHYSQAALNLAHTKQLFASLDGKSTKSKGAGA